MSKHPTAPVPPGAARGGRARTGVQGLPQPCQAPALEGFSSKQRGFFGGWGVSIPKEGSAFGQRDVETAARVLIAKKSGCTDMTKGMRKMWGLAAKVLLWSWR